MAQRNFEWQEWNQKAVEVNGRHNSLKALEELWDARLKPVSHYLYHYKQPQLRKYLEKIVNYMPVCSDTLGSSKVSGKLILTP